MSAQDDVFMVAAEWHTRIHDDEPSPATLGEFEAWLAASRHHREAYEAVVQMWTNMGEARTEPRVLEVRRAVHSIARKRPGRLGFLATAAGLACVGVLLEWQLLSVRPSIGPGALFETPREEGSFRTSIGERSTITLSDESSIVMDTDTRINISYSSQARRVRLVRGQAWFHVARDASRPFTVEAGDQRVVAHGTVFDVRVEDHRHTVQVTLLEGRVSVEPIRWALVDFVSPAAKIELVPGEELTAGANRPINKQHADIARVSSWIKGQLIFNGDPLDSAIAELNRYTTSRIELSDPALASFRVSGVFYAGHSDSFLQTLTSYYPIRVIERTGDRIVLGRKPSS